MHINEVGNPAFVQTYVYENQFEIFLLTKLRTQVKQWYSKDFRN